MASLWRPQEAFIVHLDNGKKFAVSFNKKLELMVMFGKYTNPDKTGFKVVNVKTFGNSMSSKYSESDLKDREVVK